MASCRKSCRCGPRWTRSTWSIGRTSWAKLKSIKEGQGTLLDHTLAAWATTNGAGGHGRDDLPLILCGGAALGIKHQGHLVKKGVMVGNVWQTIVDRIGMPLPKGFPGRPGEWRDFGSALVRRSSLTFTGTPLRHRTGFP